MSLKSKSKGQSVLEYAILLAVVVAALLIMQYFVKRGYQGGLKDSADKMGDQFAGGGTTVKQERTLDTDQNIQYEANTKKAEVGKFLTSAQTNATGVVDQQVGAYSFEKREGGKTTSTTEAKTDSAAKEKVRHSEYQTDEAQNFTLP
ncbi:hypothetical protein D4R78_03025 [bacterium]|nr:MAG: hypothetical protein D4R78_03025 [bacterium]